MSKILAKTLVFGAIVLVPVGGFTVGLAVSEFIAGAIALTLVLFAVALPVALPGAGGSACAVALLAVALAMAIASVGNRANLMSVWVVFLIAIAIGCAKEAIDMHYARAGK